MTDELTHYFAQRRTRTLMALGLPLLACGPATTTATAGNTQAETTSAADREPGPPPVADPTGLRCGPDQLHEVACTAQKDAACPSSLASRAGKYISRIEDFGSERPFSFDSVLTMDLTAMEPARPKCCFVRCGQLKVAASAPMPKSTSADMAVRSSCISMPDAPSSFPAPDAPKCPAALALPGTLTMVPFERADRSVEDPAKRPPSWIAERCCYSELTSIIGVGRPYRVRGERVLPAQAVSMAQRFDVDARVAAHWHDVARGEHASVLAFAALARQLEHVAAPEALVRRARHAARQEEAHAQMAYGWLAELTGERVVAQPLDLAWAPRSLRVLAIEALRDGCFEEGLGAAVAQKLAHVAVDPSLRQILARMAKDEAEHAELSWSIIAFAVERDPAILRDLEAELQDIECEGLGGAASEALEALGVPAASTMRSLAKRVVSDWLQPCLQAIGCAASA